MQKTPWFVSRPWEGDSFLVFALTSIFFRRKWEEDFMPQSKV